MNFSLRYVEIMHSAPLNTKIIIKFLPVVMMVRIGYIEVCITHGYLYFCCRDCLVFDSTC